MSSAVISTSAAHGRPFIFDAESDADKRPRLGKKPASPDIAQVIQSTIQKSHSAIPQVTPASHLEIRPAPEMVTSGIPALDALAGGLPRGCLTEIYGPASSGRTSIMLAALAAATRREEYCALMDASDALDPHSVAAAGVDLDRLLWVRCGEELPQKANSQKPPVAPKKRTPQATFEFGQRNTFRASEHTLEQVLRATDLLLESGGFGLIVLDLGDIPPQAASRIPLTTWFRFRRAVENKPTILLAIEQQPIAGSCSSLLLQLGIQMAVARSQQSSPAHAQLFTELRINAELIRSRLDRKPARSVAFATKTAWAS